MAEYGFIEHGVKFREVGEEEIAYYPVTRYREPLGHRRCRKCATHRARSGKVHCLRCQNTSHDAALVRYRVEASQRDARRRNSKRRAVRARQAREAYRAMLRAQKHAA